MDRDLIRAIEINGVATYESLSLLLSKVFTVDTVLRQVEAGQATEEAVADALAEVKGIQDIIRLLGETALKGLPSYEKPKEVSSLLHELPTLKKVLNIDDFEEIAYTGNPDRGVPGTVDIGFRDQ